jgi:hypothetical protein
MNIKGRMQNNMGLSHREPATGPANEAIQKFREELEDYNDLRCLRSAKAAENGAPTIGLNELKKKLIIRVKRTAG